MTSITIHDEDVLQLKFTLFLAEPPSIQVREKMHKWLDFLFDRNMTEYSGTVYVNKVEILTEIPGE
jgi:hypothetical protein